MSIEAQIDFCKTVLTTTKSKKCKREYLMHLRKLKYELRNRDKRSSDFVSEYLKESEEEENGQD